MTSYVVDAIIGHVARLRDQGSLDAHPVRLDGFAPTEITSAIPAAEEADSITLYRVLSTVNRDETREVNSERATRLRNLIGGGGSTDRLVLFVPRGEVVESSLDEPAFHVVSRSSIFRLALARLMRDRAVTHAQVQALREASTSRHPESIYAYLVQWRSGVPTDPETSYRYLGLLSDSAQVRDLDEQIGRLRENSRAMEILSRLGLPESRVLDELVAKVGIHPELMRAPVRDLVVWLRSGRHGAAPSALDFATWVKDPSPPFELRWEPNLAKAPHVGFDESPAGIRAAATSIVEWTIIRRGDNPRFELELVEDVSRETLKSLGKTKAARKKIVWATALRGLDLRDLLTQYYPAGEFDGWLFRIRLQIHDGDRWLDTRISEPFGMDIVPLPDADISGVAPTAYHALYQYHASRFSNPVLEESYEDGGEVTVRLASAEKKREAKLDVGAPLLAIERAIFEHPERLGPWSWRRTVDGVDEIVPPTAREEHGAAAGFVLARSAFLRAAAGRVCLEAVDLLDPTIRPLAEEYVRTFEAAVSSHVSDVSLAGGIAAATRQELSRLVATDTIRVAVRTEDGRQPVDLLLMAPSHPGSVSWLLEFQGLIQGWTRGKWDGDRKPAYRADRNTPAVLGGVAAFTIGPRTMVLATPSAGFAPESWGFGGNLTATWQVFLPIGATDDIRARNWGQSLAAMAGLGPRPVGTGRMDARRIGDRLKRYAILHPYATQLRIAAVGSGDFSELLEALRVIDEKAGTPLGALSISDIRYEVTLIGPEGEQFGRAVDDLTANPGDDRWRGYAAAVLDNRETVLAPGFSYAKRSFPPAAVDPAAEAWANVAHELDRFGDDGLHVAIIGPMLATSVGSAVANHYPVGFRNRGLAARPTARNIAAPGNSPFSGNWILTLNVPEDLDQFPAVRTAARLIKGVDLALGTFDASSQCGLQVTMAGPMTDGFATAHRVADWVIVADPLFSIEHLDRRAEGREAVLLDFSPEFEPYPEGRVVVTTQYLREVELLGDAVIEALSSSGAWTRVLASISARLLLSLSNPTIAVVHGLAGVALSRTWIGVNWPDALVIPIDGHEDMFVFPKLGHGAILADMLAIYEDNGSLVLEVVESKWSTKGNLTAQVRHGVKQSGNTAEVLRAAYLQYDGLDRDVRLENLREVVGFHAARAERHQAPGSLDPARLETMTTTEAFDHAVVRSSVLAWCPDGSFGSESVIDMDGTTVYHFDSAGIASYDAAMRHWPHLPSADDARVSVAASAAIQEVVAETSAAEGEVGADTGVGPYAESTQLAQIDVPRAADEFAEVSPAGPHEMVPVPSAMSGQPGGVDGAEPALDVEPGQTPGDSTTGLGLPRSEARVAAASHESSEGATALRAVGDGCVRLGSELGVGKPALWCPPDLSNGHLVLIGGSGAGKTTTLRHLAGELEPHVPVLILDFHGDIEVPGASSNSVAFDYSGNTTFVNPFYLETNLGSRLPPSRLKWEFLEAWRNVYPTMGVHQVNYLAELVEEAYASRGIAEDPATWTKQITFGDVIDQFDASPASDNVKARIASYMKQFREWRIFHGGQAINVESFLDGTTRLDLSQLYETARDILADVVLRRLFLLVRALGPVPEGADGWSKFRIYVVIDEAQVLMRSSNDAKASLARYAAEARKFGIGLVLSTQLRDNVPGEIWGNIDTRLFMQALDPMERSRNARAANVPEAMLRSLGRGQAILTSSSQPDAPPVLLQIEPSWMRKS